MEHAKKITGYSEVISLATLFVSVCFGFMIYSPASLTISLAIEIILIAIIYKYKYIHIPGPAFNLLVFYLICIALTAPFGLLKTPVTFYHLAVGVSSLVLGYFISSSARSLSKSLQMASITLQIIVLLHIFQNGASHTVLESFIEGASSNGITSLLVVLQATYLSAAYAEKRPAPILSSLNLIYICIAGYGRASIIAAAGILLLSVYYFVIGNKNKSINFIKLILILSILFVLFIFYFENIYFLIFTNTKLSAGLVDYHRLLITEYYIGKINIWTFVTGLDVRGTMIESMYYGNLHSSFLRAHSLFGILYISSIFVIVCFSILLRNEMQDRIFVFLLCLIVLFRAFSEPFLFPAALDIFFFIILFYGLVSNRFMEARQFHQLHALGRLRG